MADKTDDLLISISTDVASLRRANQKIIAEISGVTSKVERQFNTLGSRIDRSFSNIGKSMLRNITGPLAGLGSVLATREVASYADTWTRAGNQIAAAGQIAGRAGRSLEDINDLANSSRAGFEETSELYARLLRSTAGVANSEEEVARATTIVNKAFKAGGASASEMAAGILQLSQGLSSGILAGDELRSVRENAPILAQAIADYFKTTVGGLKKLGSEGKLTSDQVFKAILAAQGKVEAAFSTTNATIADGMTKVNNALIQYIGGANQSSGATAALNEGLNALADNFDAFADTVLKVAAVIAGALVGRSITGMIASLGSAAVAVSRFVAAARAAQSVGAFASALGGLGAAAGPIAAIVGGGVAIAIANFASEAASANAETDRINKRLVDLGIRSGDAAKGLRDAAAATDELAEAERKRAAAATRQNLEFLKFGNTGSNFMSNFTGNSGLQSLAQIINRAQSSSGLFTSGVDRDAYAKIAQLAQDLQNGTIKAADLQKQLQAIAVTDVSQPVIDLADRLYQISNDVADREILLVVDADTSGVDEAREAVNGVIQEFATLGAMNAIPPELDSQVRSIVSNMDDTEDGATRAIKALMLLGEANPDFSALFNKLYSAIGVLAQMEAQARAAKAAADAATGGHTAEQDRQTFRNADYASLDSINAGQKYLDEQERKLGLTREQRDVEKEIARIRKDMPDGAFLTDEQVRDLAQRNIAQKAADRKRGGGSKSAPKTFDDRFTSDLQDVRDRTEALALEAQTIGLTTFQTDKRKTALELEQQALKQLREEARKKGQTDLESIQLSPDQIAQIDQVSEAYARQAEIVRQLQESHEKAEQAADDFYGTFKSEITSAIKGAESFQEALGHIIEKLGEMLLSSTLDSLFKPATGGGSGGLFGSIIGGLGSLLGFASGTANTGGARGQPRGVVHGQEAVIPLPSGGKVPVQLQVPTVNAPTQQAAGGEIRVVGIFTVENGELVPLMTQVSGQVAGQTVKQYDSQLQTRTAEKSARYG